ncbi:MAG: AlkZ family DNA glycosylase [Solirubrobacterales bacterium]|nr:AlkZ family DNA glycosylase [Solirubrobacterales bacterium]
MIPARLTAQLLAGTPARDPVAVVERLLAVQAQDARGARLAIRARSAGLTAGDVDRALTEDRSLLISWLNRGTLHLVTRHDYPWLQALTTPPLLTGNVRRLAQEGVTPDAAERAVEVIARSLADEGPLTREQLRARVEAAGTRTDGQALVHLLALASLRGLIVRGPMVGKQHAFVLVRDWLGELGPVSRDRALAELARRYLAGHGPADPRDLAKWSGLPLRDARAGLEAIASELEVRPDGLVTLAGQPAAAQLPPPRLLGAFDPLLMGWTSRTAILGDHDSTVVTGGIFRPFALVGGRGVATWRVASDQVEIAPFARVSRADRAALEIDAEAVARFLGLAPKLTKARQSSLGVRA